MSREWATQNGMTLDESLRIQDLGVSGFKGKNATEGALSYFLNDIDAGKIPHGSFLLIESFDRLSRNEVDEAYTLFRSILKKDVNIVTLKDGQIFTKESLNDITKIIYSIIMMSGAHEESANKSRRLKIRWQQRRDNIKNKKIDTHFPNWLKLTADRSDFNVIPPYGDVIKNIFKDWDNGIGVVTIASKLNQGGIPPMSKTSKIWKTNYIQQILKNKSVIGEYQMHTRQNGQKVPNGTPITDYFPRIISDELFYRVSAKLNKAPQKTGRTSEHATNLFAGKLFCPYCGERMFIHYMKSKSTLKDGEKKTYKDIKRLTCTSAKNGLCINLGWNLTEFEKQFLELSIEIRAKLSEQKDTENIPNKITSLEGEIDSLENKLKLYTTEFEKPTPKPDSFMTAWGNTENLCKEKRTELKQLKTDLELSINKNPYEAIASISDIDSMTIEQRENLANIVHFTVSKIYVWFAGDNFTMAKAVSMTKKLRRDGTSPVGTATKVRKELDIDKKRFLVVELAWAGVKNRWSYPLDKPLPIFPFQIPTGTQKPLHEVSKDQR